MTEPVVAELPTEWAARLGELAALRCGWLDGAGHSVDPAAIETAKALLLRLVGQDRPGVFPTPEGGIQLEWPDGDLEVLILPDGSACA